MRTVKEIRADLRNAEEAFNGYREITNRPVRPGGSADEFERWNHAAEQQDILEPKIAALKKELALHPAIIKAREVKNATRRAVHSVARSLGLKRVRGPISGSVYYE